MPTVSWVASSTTCTCTSVSILRWATSPRRIRSTVAKGAGPGPRIELKTAQKVSNLRGSLQGKQLVKELGGEREPFLRKWMAHYLAELMERTESANEQEAQTAKDKCAKIITKLWEQGIERDVTQLRNKLWRLIPISSDDIDYNSLRNALANPEQVKKLDESTIEIYFSLADVEDWLVRILAISHVISTPEEEIEDESVNRLMQQENGKQMVKRIAKLFPAFAELEITDLVAVDQQVSVALRAIYQLRLILLGVEEGGSLAK